MESGKTKYYEDNIKKLPLKERLKLASPNMILTGIVIGPGAITTASMIGARYGYTLIWLFLLIAFMGTTFIMTTNHLFLMTGLPIIDAIRKYYGKFVSMFVGLALFISCMFFTIGNVSGTGAGMELVFGINWKIGSLIMIAIITLVYFSKNVYSKIEKFATVCVIGMIIDFFYTLIKLGGPDLNSIVKSTIPPKFPKSSFAIDIGFISTNASLTTGIYSSYLGKEKKWNKKDLFNGKILTDSIMHIIGVIAISMSIMLVGAIVLNPKNITISSPKELGEMLKPALGVASRYIMGGALLASAFSSLLGNTQRSVVLLNAGFDKPTNLESRHVKYGSFIVLFIGAVIAFMYGGSPTSLILIANICTSIATPVAGLFILLMIFRKDINKGIKRPIKLQIFFTISYVIITIITIVALKNQISSLF